MKLERPKKLQLGKILTAPIAGRVIGKIKINGPIMASSSRGPQGRTVNPDRIAQKIQWAESNGLGALIFEINSPGGAVVPSKEVAESIKKTKLRTVAWVRDLAASGGYWIASACDRIVADSMSGVGSIGVISAYLEFSELLKKYGVGYEGFKSGEFKDMGIPFRKPTSKERSAVQDHIDKIHESFVAAVAENRGLDKKKISKLATGKIYLGDEALKLGLVDRLGGRAEAIATCEKIGRFKHLFVSDIEDFREELFMSFASFLSAAPQSLGKGIGHGLFDRIKAEQAGASWWGNIS